MDLDIAVDLSVLLDLDFPVPCGHSQHETGDYTHGGPAEFIAVSYHDCPSRPESPSPYYYPCCATWAAYVTISVQQGLTIVCSRCGEHGPWADFVNIVDTMT
jgi:hypothetical protein